MKPEPVPRSVSIRVIDCLEISTTVCNVGVAVGAGVGVRVGTGVSVGLGVGVGVEIIAQADPMLAEISSPTTTGRKIGNFNIVLLNAIIH